MRLKGLVGQNQWVVCVCVWGWGEVGPVSELREDGSRLAARAGGRGGERAGRGITRPRLFSLGCQAQAETVLIRWDLV